MKNWKRMLLSLTISAGLLATSVPAMAAPQQPAVKVNNQVVEYSLGTPVIEKARRLFRLEARSRLWT